MSPTVFLPTSYFFKLIEKKKKKSAWIERYLKRAFKKIEEQKRERYLASTTYNTDISAELTKVRTPWE